MNESFEKYEEYKKQVEKEIIPTLKAMVVELKAMVGNSKLESFSFLKNDDCWSEERPLYLSVSCDIFNDLRLGVFEDFLGLLKNKKIYIEEETLSQLKEINSSLYFLNKNFSTAMPLVEQTYYSKKAALSLDGFKDQPIKKLLPDFVENEK